MNITLSHKPFTPVPGWSPENNSRTGRAETPAAVLASHQWVPMKYTRAILATSVLLLLAGCSAEERRPSAVESREARREAERSDRAARAAGRAAYSVAQESKKAAKTAGRVLRDAAREAQAGWKEASQEAREKRPPAR